ncbi:unnamed protein product [Linum trigynum]|uniref:Uncharacterized protein n=1 Tax=Linum trigynum TaxID=586398 RepID=A0AAV2CY64_9ROSI
MREIKLALKKFNKEVYGNLQDQVKEAADALQSANIKAFSTPTAEHFESVIHAKDRYDQISKAYESFCWQKSRVSWLTIGDKCSNFFYQAVKIRNSKRAIRKLVKESGEEVYQTDLIVEEVIGFYKKLLGETNLEINPSEEEVQQLVQHKIPQAECADLIKTITVEEIRNVIFGMSSQKAPGPDGFSAGFFKKTWGIIGDDVSKGILFFFNSGNLPSGINSTAVSLLPKVPNADSLKNFRPISCINFLTR